MPTEQAQSEATIDPFGRFKVIDNATGETLDAVRLKVSMHPMIAGSILVARPIREPRKDDADVVVTVYAPEDIERFDEDFQVIT